MVYWLCSSKNRENVNYRVFEKRIVKVRLHTFLGLRLKLNTLKCIFLLKINPSKENAATFSLSWLSSGKHRKVEGLLVFENKNSKIEVANFSPFVTKEHTKV